MQHSGSLHYPRALVSILFHWQAACLHWCPYYQDCSTTCMLARAAVFASWCSWRVESSGGLCWWRCLSRLSATRLLCVCAWSSERQQVVRPCFRCFIAGKFMSPYCAGAPLKRACVPLCPYSRATIAAKVQRDQNEGSQHDSQKDMYPKQHNRGLSRA